MGGRRSAPNVDEDGSMHVRLGDRRPNLVCGRLEKASARRTLWPRHVHVSRCTSSDRVQAVRWDHLFFTKHYQITFSM